MHLTDLIQQQMNKVANKQLSKQSEKVILFLTMLYLCKNVQTTPQSLISLFNKLIKYLKESKIINQCFHLLVQTLVTHLNLEQAHYILLILLKNCSTEQLGTLIMALSEPTINSVKLLRRLSGQRLDNEDIEAYQAFQMEMKPAQHFVEAVVQTYIKQVNNLYSKYNRVVILELAKLIPDLFQKQQIIHELLHYYDKTNYYIRNTASLALGELIKKSVLDEEQENAIIKLLIIRCFDDHVHARSCVLYVIRDLIKSKSIKVNSDIMYLATERLKDKSAFARKAAVILLNEIIIISHRVHGQNLFKPKVLEQSVKQLQQSKLQLVEDCLRVQDKINNQETDMKPELDDIEFKLHKCRDQELIIKTQTQFQDELTKAIGSISKLVMSKYAGESMASLRTYSILLKYHQEGIIGLMKTPMILVFNKDVSLEVIKLYYAEYICKPHRLVSLLNTCDILELVCLEELFNKIHQNKYEIKQPIVEAVWKDYQNKKNNYNVIKLVRMIGIDQWVDIDVKLSYLLAQIKSTTNYSELSEILEIIHQLKKQEISIIFIKKIIQILQQSTDVPEGWYICCEKLIRFVVEDLDKPESVLQQFLWGIPSEQIEKLIFADSVSSLKLFIYSDQLVKEYANDSQKEYDEYEMIEGGIQEHLEEKAKDLQQLFERIGSSGTPMKVCVSICKNMVLEPNRERNTLIDTISVISLIHYMIISRKCTEDNIQLIYELLESQYIQSTIKCNILIGMADVYYRHSSIININTIIDIIDNKHLQVRRTGIVIMSHLMLMDVLKTDVAYIAKHMNDPDQRIKTHAKIFFVEFYKKDPQQIYYVLPDLITNMAANYHVTELDFKQFAQEVIPLIDKDKIVEQLLLKFVSRFEIFGREAGLRKRNISNIEQEGTQEIIFYNPILLSAERECRFLSICLLYLQYPLDNLRVLVENFSLYKGFLNIPFILDQFKQLYLKCRRVAITQKTAAKKSNNEPDGAYEQLLLQFKTHLNQIDPTFHLDHKPLRKPIKKQQQQQQHQQQPRVLELDSQDESNQSMEIEV